MSKYRDQVTDGPFVRGADPETFDSAVADVFTTYPHLDGHRDIDLAVELAAATVSADPEQKAKIYELKKRAENIAKGIGLGTVSLIAHDFITGPDHPNWTGYPRWMPRRLRRTRMVKITNMRPF